MLLYFLPRVCEAPTPADLEAAGIGYALDRGLAHCGCVAGPSGTPGTLVCDASAPAERLAYLPDRQEWCQIPGTEAWVGRYTGEAITPEQLARKSQLDGYPVQLGDGRYWICPRAMGYHQEDGKLLTPARAVPSKLKLDASGQWVLGDPVDRYASLWRLSERVFDALVSGTPASEDGQAVVRMTFPDKIDAAVECLGFNYRLGRCEASLLGLLDNDVIGEILGALVDVPAVDAFLQKKRQQDTSNTSPGGVA